MSFTPQKTPSRRLSMEYDSLLKEVLAVFADWLNRKWILKTFLQFLPGIWSPIVSKIPWLLSTNKSLNWKGWLTVGIIYSVALIISLLTAFKNSRDQKRKDQFDSILIANSAEIDLRKTISAGENNIEKRRVNRIIQQAFPIGVPINRAVKDMIKNSFNPQEHITSILAEIVQCFTKVTELQRDKIYISAAWSSDGKADWRWLYHPNTAGTAELEQLLNCNSAFKKVVDGIPYFYCNDKKQGAQKNSYLMDGKDDASDNNGSIICWEVMAKYDKDRFIRMIVSISTYGQKIHETDNDEQFLKTLYEDRIKGIILEQFENELIEDLLLYRMLL